MALLIYTETDIPDKCLYLLSYPSQLVCRVAFAVDIELESQRVQADIGRMQQQLQLFDNHTDVPSAYAQKHAIDPNSPARLTQDGITPAPAPLRPFLFVGVLSVARNAGMPGCMVAVQGQACCCVSPSFCLSHLPAYLYRECQCESAGGRVCIHSNREVVFMLWVSPNVPLLIDDSCIYLGHTYT